MKKNVHPEYSKILARCSCGNIIHTYSTFRKNLNLDICNMCHPFFTGKQRIIDSGGRVEQFNKKFRILSKILK